MMTQTTLSVVIKGLFLKAQFQICTVFSYMLHRNATLMRYTV